MYVVERINKYLTKNFQGTHKQVHSRMTTWSANTNTTAPVHVQKYTLEFSGDTSLI